MYDSGVHYSGVWFLFRHVKVTWTPEEQQVLTSALKTLACRECERYAVHNVRGVLLHYFRKLIYTSKVYSSRGVFHADMIGESSTEIARKTAKLFQLLYLPTQWVPTIVNWRKFGATDRAMEQGIHVIQINLPFLSLLTWKQNREEEALLGLF